MHKSKLTLTTWKIHYSFAGDPLNMSSQEDMEDDPTSPASGKERLRLDDCEMEIGSCGKKNPLDQFMTIDLVFKFSDDPHPRVVGEHFDQL